MVNELKNDVKYNKFLKQIFKTDSDHSHVQKKKALLDESKVAFYTSQLLDHLSKKEPYLDVNLSLRSLADQMDIRPNQLSWLLNESMGNNFNEFINHYRVKAFKSKAKDPDNSHLTIEGMAYESGFNSKTVFNTYFKKETGITPKQFLSSQG